jgi:hypothetical protein
MTSGDLPVVDIWPELPIGRFCGDINPHVQHDYRWGGGEARHCGGSSGLPERSEHVMDLATGEVTVVGAPMPERAGREGDSQSMPIPNDEPGIHSMVIADLRGREALGVKRYGTKLQARNGRNPLIDAYEECLDLAVYLKQAIIEQDLRETGPAARDWQPPARFRRPRNP